MVLLEMCYGLSISYASKHIQVNRQNLYCFLLHLYCYFFKKTLQVLFWQLRQFTRRNDRVHISTWMSSTKKLYTDVSRAEWVSPTEVNATYRIFFSWSVYTQYVIITDILGIWDFKYLSTFLYNKVLVSLFHF